MALCVGRHWWRVISEAASASVDARAERPTQHSKETCSLAGVGVCDAGGWVGEEGVGSTHSLAQARRGDDQRQTHL